MRSVGLDLGARHIAYCEVLEGKVVKRGSVRRLSELEEVLKGGGPARVAFEASREGWHVHDVLAEWGHCPLMLDTTRVRRLGVGSHGRKNDAIDAEVIAHAVESGRLPLAHVLSPERRQLRSKLSVRTALVETRAQYVTTIRGLARAAGKPLASCATSSFVDRVQKAALSEETRALIGPLVEVLRGVEEQLKQVDDELSEMGQRDPVIGLCATVPGVGLIVAATFVSVIDDAKRFHNGQAVGAYLGLVPSENTTGGPDKRRLGAITKRGNSMARAMLLQSAWHILRAGSADDGLRRWGERIAQNRKRKIAAVALARKLACVMWAMWRDGTAYDPSWQMREQARGTRRRAQRTARTAEALQKAAIKLQRRSSDSPGAKKASPRAKPPSKSRAIA